MYNEIISLLIINKELSILATKRIKINNPVSLLLAVTLKSSNLEKKFKIEKCSKLEKGSKI